MPSQVTNYKCPACGGPVRFAGDSGKLQCDYCGSSYELAEIERLMAEADAKAAKAFGDAEEGVTGEGEWDTSNMGGDWGADAANLKTYSCPSCGAELICEGATAATSCPYCGNNAIVPGQFSGDLKPDFVIPFKLEKKAAVDALKRHYKGKFFLPGAFTSGNHVEEIQGVYVPFWLFDGHADADVAFNAEKIRRYRQGDYEVTETKHFDVRRSGELDFEKVPVDASKRMPDDLMDSIEPFDYADLKSFSTAFLPGFLADRYDVKVDECSSRADTRCSNTIVQELQKTVVGYDACHVAGKNVRLQRGKVHYALLPVWLLNTKWDGKNFLFAMNGQTGKMVGNLPMSWGKFWATFAAIFAPVAALLGLFFLR